MSEQNPYQAPTSQPDQTANVPVAGLSVTSAMLAHLRLTRPWVSFISVLGFIGLGAVIIAALATLLVGSTVPGLGSALPVLAGGGAFYLVFAAVYFVPIWAMHRFASSLTRLLFDGSQTALEAAIAHLHALWKTLGVIAIVGMGLGLVFSIVFAAAGLANAL